MVLLTDGSVVAERQVGRSLPIFRLAFRPLFLLGAMFSIICVSLWSLAWAGFFVFTPYGGGLFWHSHEMLFGFAAAIIAGFLLTAVRNWTGVSSVHGASLALLVAIWLLARLLMLLPDGLSGVTMAVDLLFLPAVAAFFSFPIIKARMWRNLFFVPLLLFMALLNGLMHLSLQGVILISYQVISHSMLLTIVLLMCIMGGRVFPLFTANGTGTARVAPVTWLERLSLLAVAGSIAVVSGLFSPVPEIKAAVLLAAGIANFIRALRWRIWITLKTPLVWSLHLSYWSLCSGLILLGLTELQLFPSASLAYHCMAVGGMGLMILSMITRVSLGHTGRIIAVGKMMTAAFLLILLALFFRVFAPLLLGNDSAFILLAASCWGLAYSAFAYRYGRMLFRPRVDGRPG